LKRQIVIVLDAMDECVKDEQETFARRMFKILAEGQFRMRLLNSSCEGPIDSEAFATVSVETLRVQTHNGLNIHDLVSQDLAKVPGLLLYERIYAIKTIVNKAQGI
jgi:hypothetical protein